MSCGAHVFVELPLARTVDAKRVVDATLQQQWQLVVGYFHVHYDDKLGGLTSCFRVHHSATDSDGQFLPPDTWISIKSEPDHQGLCDREQAFVHDAITGKFDLLPRRQDAVRSLVICVAADHSILSGESVAPSALDTMLVIAYSKS